METNPWDDAKIGFLLCEHYRTGKWDQGWDEQRVDKEAGVTKSSVVEMLKDMPSDIWAFHDEMKSRARGFY